MERASSPATVNVLLCADNGIGVGGRLDQILTEGNTDKGEGGAGSFGLGHYAVFSCSDLRYCLYASRYRPTGSDDIRTVFTGHAVLASRSDGIGGWLDPNGYYHHANDRAALPFDRSTDCFPAEVPEMLRPHLDKLPDTGTIVCALAFGGFTGDRKRSDTDKIAWAVAANFTAAIHRGGLVVEIDDRRIGTHGKVVDSRTVGDILTTRADRNDPDQRGGYISGSQAYAAWMAMSKGQRLDIAAGITATLRHRSGQASARRSRVLVYRRGMWIDASAPQLRSADFARSLPFDAVVEFNESSEVETLVRKAEGPQHRGVQLNRLSGGDKDSLREQFATIAEYLRLAVGEIDTPDIYTPDNFAAFSGGGQRQPDKIPATHRSPSDSGHDPTFKPKPKPSKSNRPNPPDPRPRPARGKSLRHFSTVQMVASDRARIYLRVDPADLSRDGRLALRVVLVSGADGTCERPISSERQTIRSLVSVDDGRSVTPQGGKSEVPIGGLLQVGEVNALEVELAEHLPPGVWSNVRLDLLDSTSDSGGQE